MNIRSMPNTESAFIMKSSRVFAILFVIAALLSLVPNLVKAQPNGENGGNLGIGVMLGEPTGVSVKSWNNSRSAFDIGAAWSLGTEEALHMHADYLLHSYFKEVDSERLAFYYGIGGRVIFADEPSVGVRVPIGLNYIFQNIPFDFFVEAAPIFDFTPDAEFAGNGAVGIRYYL